MQADVGALGLALIMPYPSPIMNALVAPGRWYVRRCMIDGIIDVSWNLSDWLLIK